MVSDGLRPPSVTGSPRWRPVWISWAVVAVVVLAGLLHLLVGGLLATDAGARRLAVRDVAPIGDVAMP